MGPAMLIERLDNIGHQRVPDDVSRLHSGHSDAIDIRQHLEGVGQATASLVGQVYLAWIAGDHHFSV